jgi:nucleoid-associated protein YgaU
MEFSGQLEKAKIYRADNLSRPVLTCLYNPAELSTGQVNRWSDQAQADKNVGQLTFAGGDPQSLKLDLFFDTSADGSDVRRYTSALLELMMVINQNRIKSGAAQVESNFLSTLIQKVKAQTEGAPPPTPLGPLKAPPLCVFGWGKFRSFEGYIRSVSIKFVAFLPNGTPIRAIANTDLVEYLDESRLAPQNPTSLGLARKTRIVLEGETIDWIAYEEYGDPNYWRHIAQANHLVNPKALPPGLILNLPPLS